MTLRCDMVRGCEAAVTQIDRKGYVYCEPHGRARRQGGIGCRRLRAGEIRRLEAGEAIRYNGTLTAEQAQAEHEADDPHCTCNDCIETFARRSEPEAEAGETAAQTAEATEACTDSPACAARGCDDCARSYGPQTSTGGGKQ